MRRRNILRDWLVANAVSFVAMVTGFMGLDYLTYGDALHTYDHFDTFQGVIAFLSALCILAINFSIAHRREQARIIDERIAKLEETFSQMKD